MADARTPWPLCRLQGTHQTTHSRSPIKVARWRKWPALAPEFGETLRCLHSQAPIFENVLKAPGMTAIAFASMVLTSTALCRTLFLADEDCRTSPASPQRLRWYRRHWCGQIRRYCRLSSSPLTLACFQVSRFPRLVGRPAIGPMAYILSAANNAAAASSVVDQGLCKAVTELFLWTAGIDDRPGTSQQMTSTLQAHARRRSHASGGTASNRLGSKRLVAAQTRLLNRIRRGRSTQRECPEIRCRSAVVFRSGVRPRMPPGHES